MMPGGHPSADSADYLLPPELSLPIRLVLAALVVVPLAFYSHRLQLLTFGGSVSQCVLGILLLGIGGWAYALPILFFFLTSSFLSRVAAREREEITSHFSKSHRRDALQVVANGGVGGMIVLLTLVIPENGLYVAYLGSVAAATADTWGTEVGVLANKACVSFPAMRRVPVGTSGAISWPGSSAGLVGSFLISLSGAIFVTGVGWEKIILPVISGGLAGSLLDSFLGSVAQSRFRCRTCGKIMERGEHCGARTDPAGGVTWIGNDAVNFICASGGAITSVLVNQALN